MKFLNYILDIINDQVSSGLDSDVVKHSSFFRLAQQVKEKKVNDDKEKIAPYIYDKGDFQYSGVDDDKDIIVYHRADNIIATKIARQGGYGDGDNDRLYSVRTSMVVFANRNVFKCTTDELALEISAYMPGLLSKAQSAEARLKQCTITINEIVLNAERVFNEEYKNVDYFIQPEHIYFKINYTIESTLNAKCFNKKCK